MSVGAIRQFRTPTLAEGRGDRSMQQCRPVLTDESTTRAGRSHPDHHHQHRERRRDRELETPLLTRTCHRAPSTRDSAGSPIRQMLDDTQTDSVPTNASNVTSRQTREAHCLRLEVHPTLGSSQVLTTTVAFDTDEQGCARILFDSLP